MQFGWSNVGSPGAMLISWLCSSSCRAAAAGQAGAGKVALVCVCVYVCVFQASFEQPFQNFQPFQGKHGH
eukprot:scaffold272735_cov15-Tisochrysis_lutea.AAC.1